MLPGVNVSLPLHAPGYSTRLWGTWWRDADELPGTPVRERFLTLIGSILERIIDPAVHRASREFLELLLPRVVGVPMYREALDPNRDTSLGAELAFEGLPSDVIADRVEQDTSFGVACALVDADLGLSSPDEIDPAVCLVWELYPTFVFASELGGRAAQFTQFVAESAYYGIRRGAPGIDEVAAVFASDCAGLDNSVHVSAVHHVAYLLAGMRKKVIPKNDRRVRRLYRRAGHLEMVLPRRPFAIRRRAP
jgi:hypothetical protein